MGEAVTKETFEDRIRPTHLEIPEKTEDLKESVEASIVPAKPAETPEKSLKAEKEYTFNLNYKDGRGKVWDGEFTNKILTIRERQLVGITRARLAAGLATGSIDDLTEEINLCVAHMMFSLIKYPDWAKSLTELEDITVVQALYEEVVSHEATFFGWGRAESTSESESGQRAS